jgi:hypothetical protein
LVKEGLDLCFTPYEQQSISTDQNPFTLKGDPAILNIYRFMSRSRIFHLYGDAAKLRPMLGDQGEIFIVPWDLGFSSLI